MNKDIIERGDIGFVDPRENSVYAEKKYVEVNEAIKTILNASPTRVWDALQVLAEMKGADVTPVRHAHWYKDKRFVKDHYCCSSCYGSALKNNYGEYNILSPYCPTCGAKMKEKVTADED